MKAFILGAAVTLAFSATATAQAPSWTVPTESQRCPSKWGAADERGSANHQKPAAVMNAAKLIKTGEVIELAYVLGPSMALSPTRRFDVHTKRTFMNQFSNMRGSNEEIVITELGQVGTQFDGFAHQTHLNSWYNCQKVDENADRTGFKKFGIHNVGMLFTRGVLIDVAGFKGVEMLGDNYEVTVDDLEGALKKQNLTLQPGDAVIVHTGWGKLYGKDNPRYMKSNPGIGVPAALWLATKDPMLLGADNPTVEVSPNPDKQLSLPVHQVALVVNGIHLLENIKLDELAQKGISEFAFVMQPLKIQGGTGSTVSPVAMR
ncbi:MAG TPA: cyclase family protein [Bradyrhizobium sp.]|nr:cyclase family protein [Bradyrhizobium sp.]